MGGFLGLGDVVEVIKDDAKDWAMLGAGSAAGVLGTDYLLSNVLVRNGTPIIPTMWSPLAVAVIGIAAGELTRRHVNEDIGVGMMAGTVGVALSAYVSQFTAPAVAATLPSSAAAPTATATAGFGFGRAHSHAIAGAFAGFAPRGLAGGRSIPYSVGSHVGAAQMFRGSTVQYEDTSGPMAGSTVQYEDTSPQAQMAGFLS